MKEELKQLTDLEIAIKLEEIEREEWEQERMYSEKDLREAFRQSRNAFIFEKDMPPVYENFEKWFEQFKEKHE